MAAACTAMEVHDRRLSISKSSSSKISKPSPSPVLKNLSASVSMSASSPSSSPPTHLPSSITSSPSRPIAKVVNADPSSFRRVVQELTGTHPSPASAGTSPRTPSRLQRIAPPPLRATTMRNSVADHPPHQQTLLEQMQHQQSSHMFLFQQHVPKVGPLSPPLPFPDISGSSSNGMSKPIPQFGNPNPNPGSEPAHQLTNTNPNSFQSLPMLSPHLLSPLPALTPGDNTWANPIEAMSHSPKFLTSASNALPPLLPLPNLGAANPSNGYGNALLPKPAYASRGQSDGMSARAGSLMSNSLVSPNGQPLPPLLATPLHTNTFNGILPPWSPSPLPFSPGSFPPSPGSGLPSTIVPSLFNNAQLNPQIKYGSTNPTMPNNFTF